MNRLKLIFKLVVCFVALSAANVSAQTETKTQTAEPTYEIVLQLLNASNAPGRNADAPALATVVKRLKTLYAFSDYRVATTFLQRTSNSVEYKSVASDSASNSNNAATTFSEWSLRNLRVLLDAQGRKTIQFDSFRFGARIPITVQNVSDGKALSVISYEPVGITSTRFTLRENEPTVLGSLAIVKPDELLFLILTVKSVE